MSLEHNQRSIARFNRWAETYDNGRINAWFKRGQEEALKSLQLRPNEWLLDVGCGTGWAIYQAAHQLPAGRACGIDLSRKMIESARKMADGLHNVEFKIADAEGIPYPPASFDAAICTFSFHHYSDPIRALSETHRVLKPGGRLVLLDANRTGCFWVWLCDRFHRLFEKGHIQYYTQQELLHFFTNSGYSHAAVVSSDHGHFRYGKIAWALSIIRGVKQLDVVPRRR